MRERQGNGNKNVRMALGGVIAAAGMIVGLFTFLRNMPRKMREAIGAYTPRKA